MSKSTTLLIDGDLIVYRSCAAVEKEVRWEPDESERLANTEEAWTAITWELGKLFERFETDKHVIALTTGKNFRYSIDPTYKSNRKDKKKPLALKASRERLAQEYKVVAFESLEADDILGIFATQRGGAILCSQDKDLRSIPGRLWNGRSLMEISRLEADLFHLTQALTGDTSDGYPGCPGIGPVKAERIIRAALTTDAIKSGNVAACVWPAIIEAYEAAGRTEEDALRQARLARILRSSDWDAEKKEPILWTP